MINFIESCKVAYTKLPDTLFQSIKKEISDQLKTNIRLEEIPNDAMHAYIVAENRLLKNFLEIEKFALELLEEHEEHFSYLESSINGKVEIDRPYKLKCEKIWFNIQKSGGYFPLHHHSGIYSFVIWISNPYFIDLDKSNEYDDEIRDGMFEFIYTDSFGKIENHLLPVDKNWEGTMAIFPSELYHQVYPFYTEKLNDLRISVSGDIFLGKENFVN